MVSAESAVPTVKRLTPRQAQIYEYIRNQIRTRGYGPTLREIGVRFGIRSPNGVLRHLKALERKGYLSRTPHLARAIQLTKGVSPRTDLRLEGEVSAGRSVETVSMLEPHSAWSSHDPRT